MAQPVSVLNTRGQSVPTLYDGDGLSKGVYLGVGTRAGAADDEDAKWLGVATHTEGSSIQGGDGVVVASGVMESDGLTVKPVAVDDEGRVLVALTPSSGPLTDRSGALAAGGVSETLAPALPGRKYLLVVNLDTDEDLWIDFTSDAVTEQPSIRIPGGGAFVMEGSYVSPEEVNVIATTISHEWSAKEA